MKLQVEEIKYRQSFQTLTICVCFADLCWQGWKTAGKRRGRRLDWKRTGCCRAKAPSAKLFYSSVGKRAEFASVQSKVPFAWHFLDNRSLINHWPWILGFLKGQPRAKTTTREREEGERVLCVRELCAILVTQGACVKLWTDFFFFFKKLINTLVSRDVLTHMHTHTHGRTHGSFGTKISRLLLEKIYIRVLSRVSVAQLQLQWTHTWGRSICSPHDCWI